MAWAAITSFRYWVAKRKKLLTGLLGVAVEETIECVPGARLSLKILNEFAKHGIDRLADARAEVPDLKPSGQVFPTEQLDQINRWLELLTTSYAGLLDKLEGLTTDNGSESAKESVAQVKQLIVERTELVREFDGCLREVRRATLSLGRIEEKLDYQLHEVHKIGAGLEDLKAIFVDSPLMADYGYTACRRRRNGNIVVEVGPLRKKTAPSITTSSVRAIPFLLHKQTSITSWGIPARWVPTNRTGSVCTICTAMSGNGAKMPTMPRPG